MMMIRRIYDAAFRAQLERAAAADGGPTGLLSSGGVGGGRDDSATVHADDDALVRSFALAAPRRGGYARRHRVWSRQTPDFLTRGDGSWPTVRG
jgi:hypothetical protein